MTRHRKSKSPPYFLYLIILILLFYSCYITNAYSNSMDKLKYEKETYCVQTGDTLWSIGEKHASNEDDIREWISTVREINDMESADITAGTEITILVDGEE